MQEKQYKVNPQHRNGNPNKSQWRVSIDVELKSLMIVVGSIKIRLGVLELCLMMENLRF